MKYTIKIYTEIWGDESEPRYSQSHRLEHQSLDEVVSAVPVLLAGMNPKYRLEIEPEVTEAA